MSDVEYLPVRIIGPTAVSDWRVQTMSGRTLNITDRDHRSMQDAPMASLRDQFAMAAIAGILGCTREYSSTGGSNEGRARLAYQVADAMLAARSAAQ